LEEERDNLEDEKMNELRRLQKMQKYQLDKLNRELETEKRKALQPKRQMEEEALGVKLDILEQQSVIQNLELAKVHLCYYRAWLIICDRRDWRIRLKTLAKS
jgi:hypothetical protein